ncbi:hypothetical protein EXE10_03195 [Acinetobacter sp. WCHAc060033]|uniref:hypothetical protein n=1 Tax=Acinetobacter sp. WCHAc060033 TaxID=2518624 RepID=UPI001023CA5B|nr:hypothetical protein [Acinetobacter sp. WCHAc060033]RZG88317.1 hypothetical protein EXE10_03195 [Acinetobacter sp. WCHAc060033]
MDNLKENLVFVLGGILAILGLGLLFFYRENLCLVIYAIVLYLPIYLLLLRKYFKTHRILLHSFSIFIAYVLLQIVWGVSPKLQFKEFEWTHPHWQPASQVQLVDTKSEVYRRSRSVSYAYMNVIYQYEYQGKTYSTEQSDLVRQYFLKLLGDEPAVLRQLSAYKLKNEFLNGQAVVLVNAESPQESIYFYSQRWFDLRGSWLAKILWGLQLVSAGAVLVVFGLAVKKVVNPHNTIQTWSKPKRYLFIAIFFIITWSVLFAGWILFMYLKNAP